MKGNASTTENHRTIMNPNPDLDLNPSAPMPASVNKLFGRRAASPLMARLQNAVQQVRTGNDLVKNLYLDRWDAVQSEIQSYLMERKPLMIYVSSKQIRNGVLQPYVESQLPQLFQKYPELMGRVWKRVAPEQVGGYGMDFLTGKALTYDTEGSWLHRLLLKPFAVVLALTVDIAHLFFIWWWISLLTGDVNVFSGGGLGDKFREWKENRQLAKEARNNAAEAKKIAKEMAKVVFADTEALREVALLTSLRLLADRPDPTSTSTEREDLYMTLELPVAPLDVRVYEGQSMVDRQTAWIVPEGSMEKLLQKKVGRVAADLQQRISAAIENAVANTVVSRMELVLQSHPNFQLNGEQLASFQTQLMQQLRTDPRNPLQSLEPAVRAFVENPLSRLFEALRSMPPPQPQVGGRKNRKQSSRRSSKKRRSQKQSLAKRQSKSR